jgi:hypothetical protein
MDLKIVLFDKDDFKFTRVAKKHYKLTFTIENNNIIISKIIDFNLIKLIYDLNPDVYEKVEIEKINDNEVIATLLIKHFFEDLGLPQRFSFVRITKLDEDSKITFTSQSIKEKRPPDMPTDSELIAIQDFTCVCDIITPHSINFSVNIIFDQQMTIPPFAEKVVGMILHKIFKRVKQFIENVRI